MHSPYWIHADVIVQPSSHSAEIKPVKLNCECSIAKTASFAHSDSNAHTQSATHTHTRTFNRTSTPSVAGRVLYPHYDLPTPPLIAYQVAPLPQPAAAPPFPQRCNYFRELPRGHKQLRSYVLVRVHVRACTCIHLRERASVKLNTNNCVCVHTCMCVCV